MQKNPIVIFENVNLGFNSKKILSNLSFEIYEGEIATIVGASGSGKSTILKLITRLILPDSGNIIVKAQKFGMAFQYAALFNSLTVWENIALALQEATKLSNSEIDKRVKDALEIVK